MNILVCFKVVPDLDQMTDNDYIIDKKMQINTSFVKRMLNCFDESSLEFGLRLSDEAEGLNLHLVKSALTVADEQAELYLKTLSALKYDHVIRSDVSKDTDIRFCPDMIGNTIAEYIKEYPQDLILMGRQAPEGNNFATPQFVSKALNIPLISNVIDIHLLREGVILAEREFDSGHYEQEIKLPVICTIGNAIISKLRVPSLKDRMTYGKRELEHIALKTKRHRYMAEVNGLEFVDHKRAGIVLKETGSLAAKYLYEKCMVNLPDENGGQG